MKVVSVVEYRLYRTGLVAILELPEGFASPQQIRKMRDAVRRELIDGTSKLIVDLSRCTYTNSGLLGALGEMYTSFTNINGHILFAAPQQGVQGLFHLLKLDQVFEMAETVDAALARLATRHERATA